MILFPAMFVGAGVSDPGRTTYVLSQASNTSWRPTDWPEVQAGDLALIYSVGSWTNTTGWEALEGLTWARWKVLSAADMAINHVGSTVAFSVLVVRGAISISAIRLQGSNNANSVIAANAPIGSFAPNARHSGMLCSVYSSDSDVAFASYRREGHDDDLQEYGNLYKLSSYRYILLSELELPEDDAYSGGVISAWSDKGVGPGTSTCTFSFYEFLN